ncbi:aminotransferase class V-fold PLP-dependent enzyme [Kibdelosporangium persicum]|uniref:Aminotransferase class V-fold PLP-dependent enzyme n=1 Tax=Kibdelosporangium persicum TaxID=2698649 RepID=A0ABX2FG51_9PSEU|nr:aminotransferase class V-fold PLP-dependent enzyme [Kibdelosporangium persicum]NRN70386.1 Aminotransferase class V-fold PLP-dependent enzyme [Kibdelosporangium persicum]
MSINVMRARADTPGVNHVAHLNNAGASLAPKPVVQAVMSHLRLESEVGPYEAAELARVALERGRSAVAELINCHTDEIAMFESATRAWGAALASIPLGPGDRVLISPMEYGSSYLGFLHLARRTGCRVEVLPTDADGLVDADDLRDRIDERVKLVAMTHVPMHDGLIYPVAAIGRTVRESGIPYLVDASQSVGQLPVDVREIDCDVLVGCGRKFLRGPRGTGFLYARREFAEQLLPGSVGLDGVAWDGVGYRLAPGARRFDTWETNCASRIGLGVAVDYALSWGVENTWRRIQVLAAGLRRDLAAIPGITVEDRGRERYGTVALTVHGHAAELVRAQLQRAGINTWVCLSNAACVDMQRRGISSLLRVSVHYYNSVEELTRVCDVLESLTVGTAMRAVS